MPDRFVYLSLWDTLPVFCGLDEFTLTCAVTCRFASYYLLSFNGGTDVNCFLLLLTACNFEGVVF